MTGGQKNVPLTPERAKKLKALIQDPPSKLGRRKVVAVETHRRDQARFRKRTAGSSSACRGPSRSSAAMPKPNQEGSRPARRGSEAIL